MTEGYGQRLAEALRVENAPAIVTRALRTADMAVTEIRCDSPLPQMSGPIQQEDAFLVALYLRESPNRQYCEDGRRASVCDLRVGESCLHDLKRAPTALFDKPYHSLAFYLPRAALDAIADDANASRIRDLSYEPGAGVNDVTISRLGSLLLPALSHPDQANSLFVDHVLLAVGVHIAQTYGGMRPVSRPARGGPIDSDTTLLVLLQQFEPARDIDKRAVEKISRFARGLYSRRSSGRQIKSIGAPQSTLSISSGLLDRGVRIPPAVEPIFFNCCARPGFAIVLNRGKSAALFRHGVRSRAVPATTVSSKMIVVPRGIITVEH